MHAIRFEIVQIMFMPEKHSYSAARYYSIIFRDIMHIQIIACRHNVFVANLSKISCFLLRGSETGTSPIVCTHRVHDAEKVRKLVHTNRMLAVIPHARSEYTGCDIKIGPISLLKRRLGLSTLHPRILKT